MCGIYCTLAQAGENWRPNCFVEKFLMNRGPDGRSRRLVDKQSFYGYVLWHQGKELCPQPVVRKHITLLFNGDLYNNEERKPDEMADSEWLTNQLLECNSDEDVIALFRTLEGPYSVIFYNSKINCLFFGRDSLGRNSLLIERNDTRLTILSTSSYERYPLKRTMELPPLGLFKLNVLDAKYCKILPWLAPTPEWWEQAQKVAKNSRITIRGVSEPIAPDWLSLKPSMCPAYDFYSLIDKTCKDHEIIFGTLLKVPEIAENLAYFDKLLTNSVRQRLKTVPYCRLCLKHRDPCSHAKISILFSGGIDCSILAMLVDKNADPDEPIELVNVAFERVKNESGTSDWMVPDRLTAHMSLKELRRLCPDRDFHFFEVNVSRADLDMELSSHIQNLIYPLETVLDESLGAAFWFAANNEMDFTPSPRVVFVGSGADELFGGYSRHRNAYTHCTESSPEAREAAVREELERDWMRLPSRNLARDDRVIGDTGKTSRAPFIEEHLAQFARSLKANQRSCFELPEGMGDKLFLRLYAYQLGLRSCSSLKKRAIQFGSRIADKNQNAQQKSRYLLFDVIIPPPSYD